MTNLSAEMPESGPIIKGFGPKGFRVDNIYYSGGLILTPTKAFSWVVPTMISADDSILIEILNDIQPEFLLLGTGATLVRPAAKFTRAIEAMNIGVEVMDSKAAARAWSVLRLEERQIVGAIMPLY